MHTAKLRIISFNIFYALRTKRLAKTMIAAFGALNPDVICLQEVLIGKKRNFCRDIADMFGYHLSFSSRAAFGARQIGLAVLSREVPEENTAVILPRSPARRPRIVQIVEIIHKGISWRIANTHLSVASSAVRKAQIASVLASLNNRDPQTPLVLAGDFNTKTQKEVALFGAVLRHAGFAAPEILPYSWRMLGAKKQFDWIATRDCSITQMEVLPHAKGSDHKPVWADIEYRRQQ